MDAKELTQRFGSALRSEHRQVVTDDLPSRMADALKTIADGKPVRHNPNQSGPNQGGPNHGGDDAANSDVTRD